MGWWGLAARTKRTAALKLFNLKRMGNIILYYPSFYQLVIPVVGLIPPCAIAAWGVDPPKGSQQVWLELLILTNSWNILQFLTNSEQFEDQHVQKIRDLDGRMSALTSRQKIRRCKRLYNYSKAAIV